ncbi:hypothetical protein ARMGADRAFT_1087039 [Armillaria gallica]|uniref:Uncharacterized protein n=1 Tax=Armillaria gallica TaxID=47427 RepID=A0A2H3CX09_ARMGA|nr:hypothetical protein ARMGADRAFT_1087039 [Armillaria gallica]
MSTKTPSHVISQASHKDGQTNISMAMTFNSHSPSSLFILESKAVKTPSPVANNTTIAPPPVTMTPVQPSQQEELSPTQPDPDYSEYWEEDQQQQQQLKAASIVPESMYDGLKPRDTQETLNDYTGGISLDEDGEEIIPDSQGEEDYILV